VQIFPIWKEKVELDVEMETLLYRNQLVDFTDKKKFEINLARLVSGLNVIFHSSSLDDIQEENVLNSHKNLPLHYPVGIKIKKNFIFYLIY
jgi:hypothetical protein